MLLLLPAGFALASCVSYPDRTKEAFQEFRRGDFDAAARSYADEKTTGSEFLSGAEAGLAALAGGDWDGAQQHLDRAAEAVRDVEDRALVSVESLGESLVALTINESLATYEGEGFERVQLHAALALTYLARGDLDGVWVEARRANALLESEEQLYEKKYRAGGLGHFVSALAYEMLERYDEAYIDYERMVEKDVGTDLAGRAMVRIASRLNYSDALPGLVERFGPDLQRPPDAAQIVLVGAVGLGPYKQAETLTIPTKDGLLQWSVPSFVSRDQGSGVLELSITGSTPLRASVIENVDTIARENLSDRIAWLAARTAVRSLLKRELTRQLAKDHDWVGQIAGDIFVLATEHADTRAWQTLPHTWQAARLFVAPGRHEVVVAGSGERRVLGTYELEAGETMIVLARDLGGKLYPHAIGGLRVDAPAPENAPANPATTAP